MASVFDDILVTGIRQGQVPGRTQAARDWFRQKARQTTNNKIYPTNMLDQDKRKPTLGPGRMFYFRYDPKTKKTLPYYDTFPLIFMVGPAKGGFYGINLHYLPPQLRAKLMDSLYDLANNKRFDETTKLRMSYDILNSASKFRFYKPTFKHYLTRHVRSRFLEVESVEWDIALFLPNERFEKATKQKVYADSRNMLR